jgi:hypothetical protein
VQTLFDGKDLTGWDGDRNIWSVLAGAITRQNRGTESSLGKTVSILAGFNSKDIQIKPLPSTKSAPLVPTNNTTTSQ